MELCSKCGAEERRPGQRWCKTCHAAYVREWRSRHPLSDAQKRIDNARSYANVYKQRGKLVPPEECEWCHRPGDLHMHHPDYDRPLYVVWLHKECHAEVHATGAQIDTTRALFAELAARRPR